MEIKSLLKRGIYMLDKGSPYILTAMGSAGVLGTAILTGRATIKAIDILNEEKERRLENSEDRVIEITLKEKVQLCWKPYISPVVVGVTSIACIIGANSVSTKRTAAMAAAYSLLETTAKNYQEKVIEQLGSNKEEKIRGEIAQSHLDSNPVSKTDILCINKGDTLCFDTLSGRYFNHDIEKIRRIQNDLNHDLMEAIWVPLNDLYYALGIPGIKLGEDIGWTVDELLDISFSSKLTDEGTPCLVIDYDITPKWNKKGSIWV